MRRGKLATLLLAACVCAVLLGDIKVGSTNGQGVKSFGG